jgi:hypothetical protein
MDTPNRVKRYDLGEITTVEVTPQGFLKVPGFATRTGVFTYRDGDGTLRRELRHPDDVFAPESTVTLKNVPVTLEHPPEMLTPENVKQYMKGYTTDRVEVNRDLLETDLIIADQEAIDAVQSKKARELSCGYYADLVEETGDFNGAQYDCRQKNVRYNHLAIVKGGRAGPEVRLRMDSKDAVQEKEQVQSAPGQADEAPQAGGPTKPVVILGKEIQLPADVADAVKSMLDRYDEMRARFMKAEDEQMKRNDVEINQPGVSPKVPEVQGAPDGRTAGGKKDADPALPEKKDDDATAVVPAAPGAKQADAVPSNVQPTAGAPSDLDVIKHELAEMTAKHDALQARVDEYAAKTLAQPGSPAGQKMDGMDARIRARAKLERKAMSLVPAETVAKFDSMSDTEILSAVIKHRHPNADLAGKSEVYIQTRFDSITESLEVSATVRKGMGSAFMHTDSNEPAADPKAARAKMIEASRNLHTQPLSANRK